MVSQNTSDILYLYEYTIKLSIFVIFALLIKEIITNEKEFKYYISSFLFILVPLYIYLHYRYMYVYETYHTGVSLDGWGLKNGKNSFGGMIALIYPYIFCRLIEKPKKIFNIVSLSVIIVATLYLYSRSMIIVVLFETIIISYFMIKNLRNTCLYLY